MKLNVSRFSCASQHPAGTRRKSHTTGGVRHVQGGMGDSKEKQQRHEKKWVLILNFET